ISDKELALLVSKGTVEAFNALYRLYSPRLFRFAFSLLKNEEDAKEVIQDVFIIIWRKRFEIRSEQSLRSYLFKISYNVVIDKIRKRIKEKTFLSHLYQYFEVSESSQTLEYAQLNQQLQEAVEALPPRRRLILKLSREQNLSHKEIAEKLGISIKTIENQITLSLRQIKDQLGSNDLLVLLFINLFL